MPKACISADEGQAVAAMTVSTLKSLHNDANLELFWQKVTTSTAYLPIDGPTIPHCHKLPLSFIDGSTPTFDMTVEDHSQVVYIEELDLITSYLD